MNNQENYMTFRYLVKKKKLQTFSFILLSVYLIQNVNGHLVVFRCMSHNSAHFTSFYVTKKQPLLLKIDRYKNGCHLKHIFGVGKSVCLSVCFLIVCVSRVNAKDACFNLYFVTSEKCDPLKSYDDPLQFSSEGHADP